MAIAQPAGPATEAFERALTEERLRSTRQLSAFRFQGVTAFLELMILFRLTITGWVSPPLGLFAGYWAAAGIVWWASGRSERLARLSGLSIPMLDMPFVLLLVQGGLAALHERGRHTDAPAYHASVYFSSLPGRSASPESPSRSSATRGALDASIPRACGRCHP